MKTDSKQPGWKARLVILFAITTGMSVFVWLFPISDGCFECIPTITPERAATIEHRGYAIATYAVRDQDEN